MDVKQLKEANEALAMLKELDLPISMEQLGKRKMLAAEYSPVQSDLPKKK